MSKYGNTPVAVDGIRFASIKEAKRWGELLLLQRAGKIKDLVRQYQVELMGQNGPLRGRTGRKLRYIADFRYFDNGLGIWVIEDAKGFETDVFKLKWAICAAMGVEIQTV